MGYRAPTTGSTSRHIATDAKKQPFNEGRDPRRRISYNCLWIHAKRHYRVVWTSDDFRARMTKEWRKALVE
jgi:hypothetical protein